MIIYLAKNNINGRFYIGRTVEKMQKRWKRHILRAKKEPNRNIPFHLAILKYGEDSFSLYKIANRKNLKDLLKAERWYIKYFKSLGYKLYNATDGGDGSLGLKHTEESKEKMRQKALERNAIGKTTGNAKKCTIDGVEYPSRTQAARELKTSRAVVNKWVKNGTSRKRARRSDYKGVWDKTLINKDT